MTNAPARRIPLIASFLLLSLLGCKSYWIDAEVVNKTGQALHELEVSYPSASFGANALAPGASYRYHFQVRNSGPMHVDYVTADGKHYHADGPSLNEDQQGSVNIQLLPEGKTEFHPSLTPDH